MVRIRFAPSPTGYLHIGGLRTCLFNWLFAKQNKGKLILRIEDTDRQRYIKGAIESLIQTLEETGLDWDEGPVLDYLKKDKQNDKENEKETEKIIKQKGKLGPYLQSERLHIYQKYAQKLIDDNHAYYCFCSQERLKTVREEQAKNKKPPRYDGYCKSLSKKEITKKLKSKTPYVIRLKVPQKDKITFKDLIKGKIEFNLDTIDDQVLLKSDGWPTYHLASVVDDHLMKITHVIRGEEWLPSIPKHLLLYRFFNWTPPLFAHLPLLLNPDRSKLSKRQGDVAVEDYLVKGYLPEALLNFIALLGWNPGNEQEIFSIKNLIKKFSLNNVQKSGAIFNQEKLDWLNGHYIRELTNQKLIKLCYPILEKQGLIQNNKLNKSKKIEEDYNLDEKQIKQIICLFQERLRHLNEIGELSKFFFNRNKDYDLSMLCWKEMTLENVKENLIKIKEVLEKIPTKQFKVGKINQSLQKLALKSSNGEIYWPLRVALSRQKQSPPPGEIAEIFGKKQSTKILDKIIKKINSKIS